MPRARTLDRLQTYRQWDGLAVVEGERVSDEELLIRVRQGHAEVFAVLVKRYEGELFGYLRRYLGNDELAEDVFQNTFLQVFLKIQLYEPGRPARPWLYAIATNQAIDALRQRNRRAKRNVDAGAIDDEGRSRSLADLVATMEASPHESVAREEVRLNVRAVVDRLPELQKQVILLAYFQGLKYQEVAETLNIPVGTVKSRLHAAVSGFGEQWKKMGFLEQIEDEQESLDRPADGP